MIYIGDGLTDVPCFSLLEKNGGLAFGVFKPGQESAKQAFQRCWTLVASERSTTLITHLTLSLAPY